MSENIDKISRNVYVHYPVNPPTVGLGLNVQLNLINAKHLEIENWQNGEQPNFTLKINDPKSIGLHDFQEYDVEKFVNDMILACNLILKKAAFSRHTSDSTRSVVERKKMPPPKSEVEDTPQGKKITITEIVQITDSVHITAGFEDGLDENEMLELLSKIRQVKNVNVSTNLKVNDLRKSLNEYESSMSTFERLSIFKNLFSSLELSTNYDGNDRMGFDLDKEVNTITGVDTTKIEDYRKFNARTKHIDRNKQDEKEYQEGLNKLGEKIIYLREASQKTIIARLKSL